MKKNAWIEWTAVVAVAGVFACSSSVGTCYYNASSAMYAQMTCVKTSGMAWSTTP